MISDIESTISRPSRARKLTRRDMDDIAKLVSTRKCTEKEACLMLNIKYSQWEVWKCRAKRSAIFESRIARIRGNYLSGLVDSIDRAGDDKDITITDSKGNQKTITKTGDWRAKAWIAEKIDTRFQNQVISQAPTVTVQIGVIHEQLKRVIGFDRTIDTIEDKPNVALATSSGIKMPKRKV